MIRQILKVGTITEEVNPACALCSSHLNLTPYSVPFHVHVFSEGIYICFHLHSSSLFIGDTKF